mmetsp:Transcript_15813/g.20798  ORF Transcript_15813/g.20798 Transcript_15813/m.20798 type:complete len:422 (-) Transcript_15813:156-1421(-)
MHFSIGDHVQLRSVVEKRGDETGKEIIGSDEDHLKNAEKWRGVVAGYSGENEIKVVLYSDGKIVYVDEKDVIEILSKTLLVESLFAEILRRKKSILDDDDKDICPLCMNRMSLVLEKSSLLSCCGKQVCATCAHRVFHSIDYLQKCPFCREVLQTDLSQELSQEFTMKRIKRIEKRVENRDFEAMYTWARAGLGMVSDIFSSTFFSEYVQKKMDKKQCFLILEEAAHLGSGAAHGVIGQIYTSGKIPDISPTISTTKALPHWLAATFAGSWTAMMTLAQYFLNLNDEHFETNYDVAIALISLSLFIIKNDDPEGLNELRDERYLETIALASRIFQEAYNDNHKFSSTALSIMTEEIYTESVFRFLELMSTEKDSPSFAPPRSLHGWLSLSSSQSSKKATKTSSSSRLSRKKKNSRSRKKNK